MAELFLEGNAENAALSYQLSGVSSPLLFACLAAASASSPRTLSGDPKN
jgi:hypothetical protein